MILIRRFFFSSFMSGVCDIRGFVGVVLRRFCVVCFGRVWKRVF